MKKLRRHFRLNFLGILVLSFLSPLLMQCQFTQYPMQPEPDTVMSKPRELLNEEQAELMELIEKRFKEKVTKTAQYWGAGPFRFVTTEDFLYIDRTDVASVAFEKSKYGVSEKELDSSGITKEALLPMIEAGIRETGLDAMGRQFTSFQDEFVGSVQPKEMPPDFDTRKVSKHVARTASFERVADGVPIFGSELLVGLMPDGIIGRFRMHWPRIEVKLINDAQKLQKDLRNRSWTMPEIMQSRDIEILDTTVGVGHSGFADPGLRKKAVVRVLFRKVAKDTKYPISSTGYKYFDESGREIRFNAFPRIPGTPVEMKSAEKKP